MATTTALPPGKVASTAQEYSELAASSRLSLPFSIRFPLSVLVTSGAGFALGMSQGALVAGLRYRAENAHRFPTTQAGWYLYHKSKNYHVALGGIFEGFRMAGRLGFWAGVFVGMEECIDAGRIGIWRAIQGVRGREWRNVEGSKDFVSTMLAGIGTAGFFSAWNRFPVPTTVRTAKMGAKAGLAIGLAEDVVSLARGRKLGYVEFIKRRLFGNAPEEGVGNAVPVGG